MAAAAFSLILVVGCQSTSAQERLGRTTVTPGSIVFKDRRGTTLGLISESMLSSLGVPGETPEERTMNFYSVPRPEALIKVAPDDVIAGLSEYYNDNGFGDWATEGAWLGEGSSAITVTIEDDVRTMNQPVTGQADDPKVIQYIDFGRTFQVVYNEIESFQNLNQRPTFEERPILSNKLQERIDTQLGLGGSR